MAVYLDHAASTPVRPEVVSLISGLLGQSGNPSSVNSFGQQTKMQLEQAREDIAAVLNCNRAEVIFTSGGTEANNLGILGLFAARNSEAEREIILTLGTEHHAVLEAAEAVEKHFGARVELIPVNSHGQPNFEWLEGFLEENSERVALVAAIWANNETGTVIDVPKMAAICKRYQVPMHSDAVAAVGHMEVDFSASGLSTMAFTGHKIGAPVGTGVLLVGRGVKVYARSFGGSQERGIRPGTQDAIGASGVALALKVAARELSERRAFWEGLRTKLISGVAALVPDAYVAGEPADSLPDVRLSNIVNIIFPGCAGESMLFLLDSAHVAISNGSACTAGVVGGSHVLLAMGHDRLAASSCVRVSFGHTTTEADIDAFLQALPGAYEKAKKAGYTLI